MSEAALFAIPDSDLLTDSGVYEVPDSYERVVIVKGWYLHDPRRMARIVVTIHRQPSKSQAVADVWTVNGWQRLVERNPHRFWSKMPGFDRGGSAEATRLTMRLIEDINNEVTILSQVGAL